VSATASIGAVAANLAWIGATIPARRRFRTALDDPFTAQAALLAGCLRRNCDTEIGRALGFDRLLSEGEARGVRALVDAYRERVPIAAYDDLEPFVRRIQAGAERVLTAAPVTRLTPSSGSTAARKLLPFTSDLRREIGRAVDAWIADLHRTHPAVRRGRAYWSISPAMPPDRAGAVPVGFDSDSEYLGAARRALARRVMAVPDGVARVTDPDAFRYVTLLYLARARDLRLISVWHPSFLGRLLESLPEWIGPIASDVANGTVSAPGGLRGARLEPFEPDRVRARELAQLPSLEPRTVWPGLALVSCWADGPAAAPAGELGRTLAGVPIQDKGLVATEGIVSIPFERRHPLAVTSHFFEFLDSEGRSRLAHELAPREEYTVVLTTGGGLYRYGLGDRIEVDGWVGRTPSIRFLGKADRVSDLFGEKVSEPFVAGVLRRLFGADGWPRFAMLAPEAVHGGIAYTLFVESDNPPPDLAARLEAELRRNPHYAWCVDMRQLAPARIVRTAPGGDRAYVDACVARGQRLGDVKPAALRTETGWSATFCPDFREPGCRT
jgi:hypothetical protein